MTSAERTFLGINGVDWTGIGTVALAIIALVAAVVAFGQLRAGRQASNDTIRAYLSADFQPNPMVRTTIEFVVQNSGRTAATDVQFAWDPIPVRTVELGGVSKAFAEVTMFSGIPTLAPGREIRILFDSTLERFNAVPAPERVFALTITYTDVFKRTHVDRFILDVEMIRGSNYVDVKTINEVGKAVESIARTLDQSGIAKRQGLHVVHEGVREQATRVERDYRRRMKALQVQADSETDAPPLRPRPKVRS